jgi:hypothetical protein
MIRPKVDIYGSDQIIIFQLHNFSKTLNKVVKNNLFYQEEELEKMSRKEIYIYIYIYILSYIQ